MSQPSDLRKSNSAAAREAADRVRALIGDCEARGETLPFKKGALWHAEIKRQAGLSNGQIDGNADIRSMLHAHAEKHGLMFSRRGAVAQWEDAIELPGDGTNMVPASRLHESQTRLTQAERKIAELRAENVSLRAQIIRGNEVAELIAMGGRVKPVAQ